MPNNFGLSFAPLQGGPADQTTGQPPNGASPFQQAIQILSLRRPRTWGAAAPTAPSLISGQGGSASAPPNLLRQIMQYFQSGAQMPGAPSPYQGAAAGDLSDLFGLRPQPPHSMGTGGFTGPAIRGPVYPEMPTPPAPVLPNPNFNFNEKPMQPPVRDNEEESAAPTTTRNALFDRPERPERFGRRQL